KSPDFSKEKPETHIGEASAATFDRTAWEGEIKRLSAAFRKYPDVYFASVVLQSANSNSRTVSNEGTTLVSPSSSTRLIMEAQTRARDGRALPPVKTSPAPNPKAPPRRKQPRREGRNNGRRSQRPPQSPCGRALRRPRAP